MAPFKICAIDIGPENMGFGALRVDPDSSTEEFPYLERMSIRLTARGDYYNKYQEKYTEELVEQYIASRWVHIRDANLVQIEKQLTKNEGELERACIVIEACIKMCLRRERGAPPYIVITPVSWKRSAGIALEGEHAANKRASVDKFRTIIGEQKFLELNREHEKIDDIADVYHMLQYGKTEFGKLYAEALITRNHTCNIFTEKAAPRVYYSGRKRPYIDFEAETESLEAERAKPAEGREYIEPRDRHRIIIEKRSLEQGLKVQRKTHRLNSKQTVGLKDIQGTVAPNGATFVPLSDV